MSIILNGTTGVTTPGVTNSGNETVTGTLQVSTGAAVGGATPGAGGLAFPATAVAVADANTLDDYEEGTWTPSLGGNTTYATQTGSYTKVGRQVTARGSINVTTLGTGSSVGALTGLPFAAASAGIAGFSGFFGYFAALATNVVCPVLAVDVGATTITMRQLTAAGVTVTSNAIIGNGTNFDFTVVYFV